MSESVGFTRWQKFWAVMALVLGFLIVGGAAAVTSFSHIRDVASIGHQNATMALLYPLIVDGMMGIATVAMWQDRKYHREPRRWARFTFWFGLIASVIANVTSVIAVWGWDWIGIVIAGFPPVGLLLSVEVVSKPGQVRKVAEGIARVSGSLRRTEVRPGWSEPAGARVSAETEAPATSTSRPGSVSTSARADGQALRPEPGALVRRGRPEDDEPLPEQLVTLALQVGRAWRQRTGNMITRDGLRNRLRDAGWRRGISNVTAGRLLALLAEDEKTNPENNVQDAPAPAGANGR